MEHSKQIAATAEEVWAVLLDVRRWPEWTTTVSSVTLLGDAGQRRKLRVGDRVELSQPRLGKAEWTVTELDPPRSFVWTSSQPGVRTEARHQVTASGAGTSELLLGIEHHGPLAWLGTVVFRRLTRRYLRLEADGLAQRVAAAR